MLHQVNCAPYIISLPSKLHPMHPHPHPHPHPLYIPVWLSDHMHNNVLDEITYPFPNFNRSYFIQHLILDVITYPWWSYNPCGLPLQVSKFISHSIGPQARTREEVTSCRRRQRYHWFSYFAHGLFATKSLTKQRVTYCQLNPWGQRWMKSK